MILRIALCALLLPAVLHSQHAETVPLPPIPPIPPSVTFAPSNPSLPTLFVVGDSTSVGWGPYFVPFFDPNKVNVVIAGAAGRSSRTYMTEGIWDRVKAQIRPHDIVLIQFGHNDPFAINDRDRARGSLSGLGDETQEIDNQLTHKHEVVHTFGWYMHRYIQDAKVKGALPVVMSLTPHNVWNGKEMDPDHEGFAGWSREIAVEDHIDYIDINKIIGARYMQLGQAKTTELFAPNDKTHLTKVGWQLDALWTFEALECLPNQPADRFLSAKGKEALASPPS